MFSAGIFCFAGWRTEVARHVAASPCSRALTPPCLGGLNAVLLAALQPFGRIAQLGQGGDTVSMSDGWTRPTLNPSYRLQSLESSALTCVSPLRLIARKLDLAEQCGGQDLVTALPTGASHAR